MDGALVLEDTGDPAAGNALLGQGDSLHHLEQGQGRLRK